jgi:hypothetical protein
VTHVAAEGLERYALRWSDKAEAAAIEEHLLVCHNCRSAVVEAERYIGVLNKASLEKTEVTVAEHTTPDGLVRVSVRRASDRFWYARVVGAEVDAGALCFTRQDARREAERQFAEMYPVHTCTSECRRAPPVLG